MKRNPNPRTRGIKLLEPKENRPKVESIITTRKFDVSHYERTGELRYSGEEEIMPIITVAEKEKRLRTEITTIDQFKAIGNTSNVSKKYDVSKIIVQGLKISLLAKAEREAKGIIQVPSAEEVERFHTDGEHQELPKVEFDKPVEIFLESQVAELDEEPNFSEADEIQNELSEDELMDVEINAIVGELSNPDQMIEALWSGVESDLELIHKMYLKRAEEEYQARRSKVMAC